MEIKSIKILNIEIPFKKSGDLTILYPNIKLDYLADYELKIDYTAHPSRELFFSGWNDTTGRKKKQIWAHSPSHWLPFINQKQDILKTELFVSFDKDFKVFSNGDRISVTDTENGKKIWHYKLDKPHVVYLICLVIGDYDFKESKSSSGVPIELWYYPEQKDRVETTYKYMEKMTDFYESEIGIDYPWNSYRQAPVVDYLYGGMETTTATVYADYMFVNQRAWWMRNYVNVNAHELNHQWFGNLVSHLTNPSVWLTESFATYYAKLFERSIFGEDYYQWERSKELGRTLNAAKKDSRPIANSGAGADRWYPKGSLVLDMMRDIMGDMEFRTAIKYYVEQNYHKVTSTPDLLRAIRESTGYAFDWFFEQWILRGGEPQFQVSYIFGEMNAIQNLIVNIKQTQKTDELNKYFKVPINIDVYLNDNSKITYKNWVDGEFTQFKIDLPAGKNAEFIVFDPNHKIIKSLVFKRNFKELAAQAIKAENMIDRYDALLELKNIDINSKRELLKKVFRKETYHLTKGEALFQLLKDSLSYDIVKEAINNGDELVSRIIVENMKAVPLSMEQDYIKLLNDSCYINVEKALENLTYSFPDNDYLKITKNEIGWRGKNIRIKWIELSLTKNLNQPVLINELIDYSSESFEFETRINAINALRSLNIFNIKIADNIINAYNYWNNKLAPIALEAIKYYYKQNKYRKVIEDRLKTKIGQQLRILLN